MKRITIKINKCYKITVKDICWNLHKKYKNEYLHKQRTNRGYGNEMWDLLIYSYFNNIALAPPQTSGFDLIHKTYGKIEVKTFTSATTNKSNIGSNFKPSCLKGTGRGHNLTSIEKHNKSQQHIKKSNYHCFVDITEYPTIYIRFIKSNDLLTQYPKFTIPKFDRQSFILING
jgi:hypothetical protein